MENLHVRKRLFTKLITIFSKLWTQLIYIPSIEDKVVYLKYSCKFTCTYVDMILKTPWNSFIKWLYIYKNVKHPLIYSVSYEFVKALAWNGCWLWFKINEWLIKTILIFFVGIHYTYSNNIKFLRVQIQDL